MENRGKRLIITIIIPILVMTFAFMPLPMEPVFAVSAPTAKGVVETADGVNVRKSCSTSSAKVKTMGKGTAFSITNEKFTTTSSIYLKDRWYYVSACKGYVRCDLVKRTYKTAVKGTINANGVSVRKGAGTGFKKAYTWNKGKSVDVVLTAYSKSGDKWYKVKNGSSYYYIYAKYVTLGSSNSDISTKPGDTTKPGDSSKPSDTTKPDNKVDIMGEGKTTDDVNYRTGPGTNFPKAGTLAKGKSVDIYDKAKDSSGRIWYKVKINKSYYYIISTYVSLKGNDKPAPSPGDSETSKYPMNGWVTDNGVNIRTGPGTSYSVKTSLNYGTKLSLTGTKKDTSGNVWYSVKYSGGTYYIIAQYVTTTEPNKPSDEPSESPNVTAAEFKVMLAQFPESYRAGLTALHEAHPAWRFTAKNVGISWKSALAKQCSNYKSNLTTFGGAYRKVSEETYNFDKGTFVGFDGPYWVAASKKAVAFYMDPRNWLTESGIFMFESMSYDEGSQKESVVKSILSKSAVPASKSSVYMSAGKTYNINPVYLASKTYLELGASDYMVNGKYNGAYNVFNIGATDSADGSAAQKGLDYAKSVGWTTLNKAITGGAAYIAESFIGNNQYTQYYERFNVINGYSNIGTHQYATAIHNAATLSSVTQSTYSDYGMLATGFSFEIPVYNNMPASKCKAPSELKSNNNFLDSLKVTVNGKTLKFTESFQRSKQAYVIADELDQSVNQVTVTAKANDGDAKITISGTDSLKGGTNLISVKVKSTSALTRTYKITVTRR
ncbi:MAG: SH3 domain-containing protein [Clostridia bacterium]|nr:SH3 domain-containing protein [Clostridia bacterium]